MTPANEPSKDSRDAARAPADLTPGKTPNSDMQAEDTGTEASETDSATAASRAMKQTGKTADENQR
jgi:hypothetical protein